MVSHDSLQSRTDAHGLAAPAVQWQMRTIVLIALLAIARAAYLIWLCPYNLIEDEAQYWEWSRRLDWSYYSKGPGIAWIIRASTEALGTSEWGVRMPAVVFSSIAAWALALLARDVMRAGGAARDAAWRGAFFTVCVFNLVPLYQSTAGVILTIDMPYAAMWSLAAWFGWRALMTGSRLAWIALGLAIAGGFIFKYTMLLCVPGLVLFAALARKNLRMARPAALWISLALLAAMLGLLPVAIWNSQHDWATVRHLLGHLHMQGGDITTAPTAAERWSPLWTLEFLATQIGMVGPMLILAAWEWSRSRRERGTAGADLSHVGRLYVLCVAGPIVVFYVGVTFIAEAEANWAMAGYTTLCVLAGLGASEGVSRWRDAVLAWRAMPEPRPKMGVLTRRPETVPQVAWHATLVFGIIAGLVMLRGDLLAKLPLVGDNIPRSRLLGAPDMAGHVDELRAAQRAATGMEPMIIAQHYGRASQMGFYLPDRPMVFVASSKMGGRKTQWDLWPDMNLDDPSLRGRPAVLLGGEKEAWARAFERVEEAGTLRGDRKRGRPAYLGFNYRGFNDVASEKPAATVPATEGRTP